MPPIVVNVGSSAIAAGGQNVGNARGTITINVSNVVQARAIVAAAAQGMQQSLNAVGGGAQRAQTGFLGLQQAIGGVGRGSRGVLINIGQQAIQLAANATAAGGAFRRMAVVNASSVSQINSLLKTINPGLAAIGAGATSVGRQTAKAAQQSQSAWQQFNSTIKASQSEIFALGAGAVLLTGFGLKAAGGIQEARIQLQALTGSLEAGNALMEKLRDTGREAGVPFQQMITYAVQLLPVLKGDTKELERWFDVVRRTATLNRSPTGGIAGAAFSLREAFLSVEQGGRDFVSLADRFNISKKALQQALEVSGGDFIDAMNLVLNQMGITTEMADRMAESFNTGLIIAKDAAYQLAAEGFGPLINFLGPTLQMMADFMGMIRQAAPEVVAFGAGFVTLVAVGVPLLLLVNRLTIAWTALGAAAQLAITRMGKISAVAGAAVIGVGLARNVGLATGNAINRSIGNREVTMDEAQAVLNKILFALISDWIKSGEYIARALYDIAITLNKAQAALLDTVASMQDQLASITPIPGIREFIEEQAKNTRDMADASRSRADSLSAAKGRLPENIDLLLAGLGRAMGALPSASISGSRRDIETGPDPKLRKSIVEWARDIEKIERDSSRARFDLAVEYGQQVNEVTFQYNQSLLREAEDFGRQRLRQEEDMARNIQDIHDDATRQEAEWREDQASSISDLTDDFNESQREAQEDHDEKISDLKKDSDEKLIELEEDYQKDRQKALLNHRDKLLEAASRLDAVAVHEEQRRWALEEAEKETQHKDRIDKEKENLDDSIDEENKSFEKRRRREQEDFDKRLVQEQEDFDKRLERSREADQRRIQDMLESFELQKAREDEDRAIRIEREAADFQQELNRMAANQITKMAEIDRQEAEALQSLKTEHEDELIELGLYNSAKDKAEEDFFFASKKRHEDYFKEWEDMEKHLMEKDKQEKLLETKDERVPGFASGGPIQKTGFARVHAGEYVLSQNTTRILRDMMSGQFTQASLLGTLSGRQSGNGGGSSRSLVFNGDVKVNIQGSTNMGESQMYIVAKRAFIDTLGEISQ